MVTLGLALGACADAPITPDQLDAAGALRGGQSAFAFDGRAPSQRAALVHLELALGSDPDAANDSTTVGAASGRVFLHARALGLSAPRAVSIRWIHGDQSFESSATLVADEAWSELATLELAPHQVGPWVVEVLAEPPAPGEPAEVLLTREFTVS